MKPELKKALRDLARTSGAILSVAAKILGTILLVFITTGSILAVLVSVYITKYLEFDTDFDFNAYTLNQSSIVYYIDPETGAEIELETLHGMQNRILAEYNELPEHMINALVAIEDKRFFQHKGVDWKRTIGAFTQMFGSGSTYGGSTITQQLIKNITDEKDDTVARKIQEIMRALAFEKEHTKKEILEWYLNTCYFGQGCYGVKTAAEKYFGKQLHELTPAESASIIGITNRPTTYDPYLNPDKNKKRQEDILYVMYTEQKSLTEAEYEREINRTLVFIADNDDEEDGADVRSFFVDQVTVDLVDDLVAEKGVSRPAANTLMFSAGYKIYATIDMRIQNTIDEIYQDDENFPVVKNSEKPQSSMIVIDQYTGNVLGMAGGRGVKTGNLVRNLATQAQRQPGSSIKPVSVYAAAMDLGFITPYSVIDDSPSDNNGKNWPKNSGGQFKGRTNVLTAVQNSVNTIAVRIIETITPEKSFNFAYDVMGLKSLLYERWITQDGKEKKQTDVDRGPLALGGVTKGLTVRELTAAYCVFPNKGIYHKPRTYSHVTDMEGNIVLDNRMEATVAIKEKTAYYMNTVLQQVVTSGTGSKARLDNMPAAGKTGTTSEDKDRWFIGYSPYYTCGSWFGFTMPKKITLASSTNPALTMWKLVMDRIHEGLERKEFFEPEGLVKGSYCLDSGMAPTDRCRNDARGSRVASGTYMAEDVPRQPCNVHVPVNTCAETGQLATPYCPSGGTVALLNISRGVTDAVYVWDEQYVVRYWGESGPYGPDLPEGKVSPIASGADGALPYNTFCTVHRTEMPVEEVPPEVPSDETPVVDLPPTDLPEVGQPTEQPSPQPLPGDENYIPVD